MAPERARRKYGSSCGPCRQKKISCDALKPRCTGCQNTDEECQYPASLRQLRRRRQQPGQSAAGLGRTGKDGEPSMAEGDADPPLSMEDRMQRVEELLGIPRPRPQHLSCRSSRESSSDRSLAARNNRESSDGPPLPANFGRSKYRFRVDPNGNLVYDGLTSLSHLEPNDDLLLPLQDTYTLGDPAFVPIYQALAASKHVTVSPEIGDALLASYFSYSEPVVCVVAQTLFVRDMAQGGPFFSDFLLMTMYASGTRMIDGLGDEERQAQGDLFIRLARELLSKELEAPSKITTAQGLLLMSERECAVGKASQGWIYAGLANRIIMDLGIHLPSWNVLGSSRLSTEERGTRDRLFWSAFVWDKTISLAVGREPTFPPRMGLIPQAIPALEDPSLAWIPFCGDKANCPRSLMTYVFQPNYILSTFCDQAELALICHDIIVNMYSPESELHHQQRVEFAARTRARLEHWWREFPGKLKGAVDPSHPPWVYSCEMMYHALWILLYRLLIDGHGIEIEGHVATCASHSVVSLKLSQTFNNTFPGKMSYQSWYCAFTSLTFDTVLLKVSDPEAKLDALGRVRAWMEILTSSAIRGPSIKPPIRTVADAVARVLAQDPVLADSEAGLWLLHNVTPHPTPDPTPSAPVTAALGFLALLGPSS